MLARQAAPQALMLRRLVLRSRSVSAAPRAGACGTAQMPLHHTSKWDGAPAGRSVTLLLFSTSRCLGGRHQLNRAERSFL